MSDNIQYNAWGLILGGSSGMGLASAKKLAKHGYNIIIVHKDRKSVLDEIEKSFSEIRKMGVKLISYNQDAVDPASIQELVSEIIQKLNDDGGKIKVMLHSIARGNLKPLFKNPASGIKEPAETATENEQVIRKFFELKNEQPVSTALNNQDFDLTIHSMATNLLEWTTLLLEDDMFAKNSRIIGLTSEGDKKVWNSYAAVASAKSVLENLIKYMAVDLAPKGITANLIQAGVTDTQNLQMIPGSKFLKSFTKYRNPHKRITTPEDIADVVYLLCREEANWINGTTIIADGGEHLV